MKEKLLKWIIRKCILSLDKDDSLIAYSFAKDEVTAYQLHAERFYPDRYCIGTREVRYPKCPK